MISSSYVIRSPKGFTLLEMVFVIALAGIFVGATFPLGQAYLRRGELDSVARSFASTARYAQTRAQAGELDAAWGVTIATGSITLFQGATYATRDSAYDQDVPIPSSFVVTGTSEFDFEEGTGRTTAGTLTLTDSGGSSRVVEVNEFGTVDF